MGKKPFRGPDFNDPKYNGLPYDVFFEDMAKAFVDWVNLPDEVLDKVDPLDDEVRALTEKWWNNLSADKTHNFITFSRLSREALERGIAIGRQHPNHAKAEALWTKAFAAWSGPENKPGDARRRAIEAILEGLESSSM